MGKFISIRDADGSDWWRDESGLIGGFRICDCLRLNGHTNPHCQDCNGEGYLEIREQDLSDKELARIRKRIQLEEQFQALQEVDDYTGQLLSNRYGASIPESIRDYWL